MKFLDALLGNHHCPGCTCFDHPKVEGVLPKANTDYAPLDLQSPPHTHVWGSWEIVREGTITTTDSKQREIGTYLDQKRRCKTCGKYELDTQVSYAIEEDE